MMETLTVRFSSDDLNNIKEYATAKKVSIAYAIRELIQLALRLENMKKNGEDASSNDDENIKKLTIESAIHAMESCYITRAILSFLMGDSSALENKTAKEIRLQSKTVAETRVKTLIDDIQDK